MVIIEESYGPEVLIIQLTTIFVVFERDINKQ
jgi:hypothetical protein